MSEFATVQGALAALNLLGSADAIAEELERRGIRSVQGCPEACALADHISDSVGVYHVSVDGDTAFGFYEMHVNSSGEEIAMNHFMVQLSDQLSEFVSRFDGGEYPGLVRARVGGAA